MINCLVDTYRTSSYRFRGNYSFLYLEIQRSQYIRPKVTVHKCAETIQGRKLYEEIWYLFSYLGFSGWSTGLVQLHSWRNIAGSKPKPVLCGGGIWLPGRPSCPRFVVLPDGEPAARAEWAGWADDGVDLLRYSLALDTSPMTNGLRPAGPNLAAKWRTTGAC